MSYLRAWFAGLPVILATVIAIPAHAQQKLPDSTLFTTYYAGQPTTQIGWDTCGSLPQTEGCYGGGSFGPFTNACSIVQSVPVAAINPNTVLRYIYILDEGSTAGGATLSVYKRTDTVSQSDDIIRVTQLAVVPLTSLVAGPGATCAMVQNSANVYAVTYQGNELAVVNKTSFSVNYIGESPTNVSALTADSNGWVTIDWGSGAGASFAVYGPNGGGESGGGSYWMINPIDGVNPASFPQFDAASLPRIGHQPKVAK